MAAMGRQHQFDLGKKAVIRIRDSAVTALWFGADFRGIRTSITALFISRHWHL